MLVHRFHDLLILVRPRDREHFGMRGFNHVWLCAKTACDNDFAIRFDRLSDGIEAFVARAIEEAACVDQHQIGAVIVAADLIAFGPQARDNAFRIHKRFWAAERNDTDFGGVRGRCGTVLRLKDGGHGRAVIRFQGTWKGALGMDEDQRLPARGRLRLIAFGALIIGALGFYIFYAAVTRDGYELEWAWWLILVMLGVIIYSISFYFGVVWFENTLEQYIVSDKFGRKHDWIDLENREPRKRG